MHVFTATRQTAASELAVWELWADVARRIVWDDSLEWARADGDFVSGATGELKLKDQPPRKFEIIECEPPTQYTDRFFLPMGAKMDWHHSVVDLGTGNREVTFRVEVRGPTAFLLAPVLRRILKTKLPPTVEKLVSLAEQAKGLQQVGHTFKGRPVRCAGSADASQAARLLHDFNTEFNDPSPGRRFLTKRVAGLIGSGDVTVLVAGDGPDGIAVLRFRPALWAKGLDAHLEELYVAPEKRGQGMGRALLEETMEVSRHAGAVRIDLGTEETDTEARRLYESAGFVNHDSEGAQKLFYERDL